MKKQFVDNDYLYRFKRENQNGSVIYVCTIPSCARLITLKNIHDDEKFKIAKTRYIQDQDFDAYENVLRAISHWYIYVIKDGKDED